MGVVGYVRRAGIMNSTQELIDEYRRLRQEEPDKAEAFLEANKSNEKFYSSIDFAKKALVALFLQKDFHDQAIKAALAEDDPAIREALLAHAKEETIARALELVEDEEHDE